MNFRLCLSLAGCALLAGFALPRDARACGGCFIQQSESTVVTGHRMALSLSPAQTVLWDQIQYAGDPSEFAWVLPVKPGAVLELSTDAWFETLDAATAVNVASPTISCAPSGGFGCGGTSTRSGGVAETANAFGDNGSAVGGTPNSPVTVVHSGTVGPYETVTLSTDQQGALNQWLTDYGYGIDPSTQPVIDAYVAEGFDFIAMRLQPGTGVKEMKPVRVISPGASPALPLRMVAIGTGATVDVTLFVISEGRMAAKNFANTTTPVDLLAWDFGPQRSNYPELRQALLSQNDGRAWMTSYARLGSLLSPVKSTERGPVRYATDDPGIVLNTIAEAYVEQGLKNGETMDGSCADALLGIAASKSLVVDPCPLGALPNDPSCTAVGSSEIDARVLECGAPGAAPDERLEDLAVALTGMHPADVWLTRLESALPQAALKTDLDIEPSPSQKEVDHFLRARIVLNVDVVCPSGAAPVVLGPGGSSGRAAAAGMLLAAAALGIAAARRLARPGVTPRG